MRCPHVKESAQCGGKTQHCHPCSPARKLSKTVTGYIIYASEIRKDVIKKYPDRDFGDISKLVGTEWKNLSQEAKAEYEKRAHEKNAKTKVYNNNISNNTNNNINNNINNNSNNNINNNSSSSSSSSSSSNNNNNNSAAINNNNANSNDCNYSPHQLSDSISVASPMGGQNQYKKNNIVYKKPATVRRPRDIATQTDHITWVEKKPKRLRFSQKFIDYLLTSTNTNADLSQQQVDSIGTTDKGPSTIFERVI